MSIEGSTAARDTMEQLVEDLRRAEAGHSRTTVIEGYIEHLRKGLADTPEEDHLSLVSFMEALSVPFVSNVIDAATTGQSVARPGRTEQQLRADVVRDHVEAAANQLMTVAAMHKNDPASPFIAQQQAKLDGIFADVVLAFTTYGAVAFLNQVSNS